MTLRTVLLPLSLLLVPAFASAGDGVLEINQTCATQTGCFSGDAAGFPVTITAPGSYRLTSNLTFNNLLGPPSENFVEIDAADVDLDLNGFAIRCANTFTGNPCTGAFVAGVSIVSSSADRARVHGGSLFGMPGDGVTGFNADALVFEDLRIASSGATGLDAGPGSRVERCTVVDSGGDGIVVTSDAIVRGNVAKDNGGVGITANNNSLVEGNNASGNQTGFFLNSSQSRGGLARDNVANGNTGVGMFMFTGWVFTDNRMIGNNVGGGGDQTSGGTQGSGKYCGLTLGCP